MSRVEPLKCPICESKTYLDVITTKTMQFMVPARNIHCCKCDNIININKEKYIDLVLTVYQCHGCNNSFVYTIAYYDDKYLGEDSMNGQWIIDFIHKWGIDPIAYNRTFGMK